MNIAIWLISIMLAGCAYRAGGSEKRQDWLDFVRNSWVRDWGVAGVFVAQMACFGAFQGLKTGVCLLLSFLVLAGALSTYRYFLPKPKDYSWVHYGLHGFFTALAAIFFAWATGHWLGFGVRVIICAVFMAVWSVKVSWDVLEEGGRGAIILATAPLLLI